MKTTSKKKVTLMLDERVCVITVAKQEVKVMTDQSRIMGNKRLDHNTAHLSENGVQAVENTLRLQLGLWNFLTTGPYCNIFGFLYNTGH
ncbi:hypothetical protein KC845_01180 [Candidatus Kaiserbacteria bacterium]|nr:hypothetical protein [Candidatus Kaiserbacteria bacterium]